MLGYARQCVAHGYYSSVVMWCQSAMTMATTIAPSSYSDNLGYWSWYWWVRDQVVAIVQSMPRV